MKIKVIHCNILNSNKICKNLILPILYLHATILESALMGWTFIFYIKNKVDGTFGVLQEQ